MGRHSCSVKQKLRKGLWSPEEDEKLYNYITRFGVGCWSSVPKLAGLERCGKSCRLRWINYLRPDLKRGMFSQEEEDLIISLHEALGNKWAQIAAQLPGRTDNEIKNFWNSSLKKKLKKQGIDPNTHKPIAGTLEAKDDKDFVDIAPLQNLQTRGLPNLERQAYNLNGLFFCDGRQIQDSRQDFVTKQVYDPLFLSEFQTSIDPSNFVPNCQQNLTMPCEKIHINPSCGFDSMPNLANFDPYSADTKLSGFVMNGAKESSNVNSNRGNQMNSLVQNPGTFSWNEENKLESVFQMQFSGIKIEENQSSEDFSNFPLASTSQELTGANLDIFQV